MKRPRSVVWTLLMAGCGNGAGTSGDGTGGGRVHLMDDTANRNMFYGPNCR